MTRFVVCVYFACIASLLLSLATIPPCLGSLIDPEVQAEYHEETSGGEEYGVEAELDLTQRSEPGIHGHNVDGYIDPTKEAIEEESDQPRSFRRSSYLLPSVTFTRARWQRLSRCPYSPYRPSKRTTSNEMVCDVYFVVDYDVQQMYKKYNKDIIAEMDSMVHHADYAVRKAKMQHRERYLNFKYYNLRVSRRLHPRGKSYFTSLTKKATRNLNKRNATEIFEYDWSSFFPGRSSKQPCMYALLLDLSNYADAGEYSGIADGLGGVCSGREGNKAARSNRMIVGILPGS
eukprot:Nk52_evm1s2295 gene=Nk52_evmTU1s2295